MKDQFDVWWFTFPDKGEHPVVIISHPDRCARAALVNVLFCTSQRQGFKACLASVARVVTLLVSWNDK